MTNQVDTLRYIKALAKLKRSQAIEATLNNEKEEAAKLKAQEDILWVVHRNALIGGLPELSEKLERKLIGLEEDSHNQE